MDQVMVAGQGRDRRTDLPRDVEGLPATEGHTRVLKRRSPLQVSLAGRDRVRRKTGPSHRTHGPHEDMSTRPIPPTMSS